MKITGTSLLKKILKAIPEAVSHRRAFEELDAHLKEDKPDQVAQWEAEYAAWDKKPTGSPCIFDANDSGATPVYIRCIITHHQNS